MNEFTVSDKDSGQRLDKYIARLLPLAPKSFLYKALRNKDIRLNGKKATGKECLEQGDRILFRLPQVQFKDLGGIVPVHEGTLAEKAGQNRDPLRLLQTPSVSLKNGKEEPSLPNASGQRGASPAHSLSPELGTVLYEDEDILLADKRSGVLSQKAKPEDVSINEALLAFCGGKTATFTPSVCNRLDRNTSGLIIFAKTYRGAREMTQLLRERSASKYYLAVAEGKAEVPGHLKARLLKDGRENKVTVLPAEDSRGDLIETAYEPVVCKEIGSTQLTLLKIRLITGKTHQIRAHLASAGLPVLGDAKYGHKETAKRLHCSRLMLHSYELDLPGRGVFYAPVPEEFRRLFPGLKQSDSPLEE